MTTNKLPVVIGTISGGRDSTAMILKYLEIGGHIDYIVFSDTLEEFPMMYDYLEKVNAYLSKHYNKSIIYTKPLSTFEDWVYGIVKKGKQKGFVRGLPKKIDPCFWKREAKVYPVDRFLKSVGLIPDKSDYVKLIGYTKAEENRIQKDPRCKYPLIEYNWCEGDVDMYLKSLDLINPLYEYFSRTGCAFCPHMSLRGYYIVWKFHKKTWRYMKKVERKLLAMGNVINKTWHDKYNLIELETQFTSGNRVYDDTPAKACLCAI